MSAASALAAPPTRPSRWAGLLGRAGQPHDGQPGDRPGRQPGPPRTPGGGSGGAIYNDGDDYQVTVEGTIISGNHAREGGGAIFFVSNDRTGTLLIRKSTLHGNPNDGFFTAGYPGIFFLGRGTPAITASTIS